MIVTPAHSDAYREHGYVVIPRALDEASVFALQREADLAIAEEAAALRRAEKRFVPVSTLDDRYVVSGRGVKTPALRALLLGELMAELCRATLGPDAYLFSETFVCKMPNNRTGWIWHQDSSYLAGVGLGHYPPNLSVWIAIDRMTSENGTLRVMPWSATGIRQVVPHDLDKPWDSDEVVNFGKQPEVVVPVEAGSIVAFSGLIPHASDPNRTAALRRAYLIQYSAQPISKDGRAYQLAEPLVVGGVHQRHVARR
jgi:ectoine hydroxylase-related dioxygenase (phytanoyl-CoA dioxygenase family)